MSRLWHANYDPDVPTSLAPYRDETLVDIVRRSASERPSAAAVRFEGRVTSYGELLAEAEAFGRGLERLGVGPGDRVALVLPNCPQFIVAELGAWLVGAIVAPINVTYPDEDIAALINRAGATTAVVLSSMYDRVRAMQPRTGLRRIVVAYVRDALPPVTALLFRLLKERAEGHDVAPAGNDIRMRDLLALHRGERPRAGPPKPDEAAVLLPSGGTTGTPKWVAGAHGGLSMSGQQLFVWLRSALEPSDTLLVPLPLFHVYGLAGIQSLAFTGGLSLTLVANPRDTGALLRTIRRERPAFLCAVPTLLTAIMSHPAAERSRDALRSIKLCFSGASPLLAETKKRFEAATGGVIVEGYSLTEAQMAAVANPVRGEKKVGSVGMPLPDVDLRIVDLETGERELLQGEQGEIVIGGRQLMLGYWRQPEETSAVVRQDAAGRRWLYTGDIGYLDEHGYLFITDRKKELIKVSGYQVWPREIEEALAAHPSVLEAGVAAIPDRSRGEVPKAWVVLRQGARATPTELRAFCRERLAPYKAPAQVAIVEALPKTAVGKVLRRKLRELDAGAAPVAEPAGAPGDGSASAPADDSLAAPADPLPAT